MFNATQPSVGLDSGASTRDKKIMPGTLRNTFGMVSLGIFLSLFFATLPLRGEDRPAIDGESARVLSEWKGQIDRRRLIKREDWFVRPWVLKAPAFAIADNLYYVGNQWFASHLVVGEEGIALIDTPHKEHTFLLLESIRSLGFDPADITVVLHTHHHVDHTGATRRIKEWSGAVAGMGEGDIPKLRTLDSMKFSLDFWNAEYPYFEPFEVERPLVDGDIVDLGGVVIHCHHTPGHTPGTMSYSLDVTLEGKSHRAFLFGGPGLNFLKLDELYYDGSIEDFRNTLDYLASLDISLWLGAHPFVNDTLGKYEELLKGHRPNPFLDSGGWQRFVRQRREAFEGLAAEKYREIERRQSDDR